MRAPAQRPARRLVAHTYEAPARWACCLVYGDESGLDAQDAQACAAWAESLPGPVVSCGDVNGGDPWFSRWHDAQAFAGPVACSVTDFTVLESIRGPA